MQYRSDIDALRGIAVGAVLLFHAFPKALPGGYLGVDVFFVISGFLITNILFHDCKEDRFSLLNFYQRRMARLLPSLIVVLACALALGWLFLFDDEFEQLGFHVFRSSIYWMNFTLIDEIGYFDVDAIYKPLLHLWSLGVEEHFYIIWPLVFLVFGKSLHRLRICLWVIAFGSFVYSLFLFSSDPNVAFFHSLARFWQLSVGGLLALYSVSKKTSIPSVGWAGLVLLFSSLLLFDKTDTHPAITLLPTLSAMLIIAGKVTLPMYGGLRQAGLISYPLYLWHWVVIAFMSILTGSELAAPLAWTALAISFGLAYLNYRFIEPLRYRPRATRVLIPVVLAVGVTGGLVDVNEGLPNRTQLTTLSELEKQLERGAKADDTCQSVASTYLSDERLFAYCRASDDVADGGLVIALVGDSHAHALFDGFERVARENGYSTLLLANSSCPVLEGFRWGRNSNEKDRCAAAIEQILSLTENMPNIEKVIISTRGPVYLHGEVSGSFTQESVEQSLITVSDPSLSYDDIRDGLARTATRLSQAGIAEIYYLLENPELDFNPKISVPRPFLARLETRTMQRDLYELRMQPYKNAIQNGASENVTILDPTEFFCDIEQCFHFLGGQLYSDDDHTSIFGAEMLTRHLDQIIFND